MTSLRLIIALPLFLCLAAAQNPEARPASRAMSAETGIKRSTDWLLAQRFEDWGWGSHTPRVVLALQLGSTAPWFSGENLQSQLSGKQMELEIVLQLWRHHESPLTPGRLAQYTLALNAVCRDPRHFHGHDLIGTLSHHEAELDFDFAYSSLAVCSSGAHVRKRQLRRLLDIVNKAADHNVDTLSMVLLALNCIVHEHRNRNLDNYIKKPSKTLAQQQNEDGSFGNLHSTALAIQALEIADATIGSISWNKTAAVNFILSRQASDGSFGDVLTTAEMILGLGVRSLSSVREITCSSISGPVRTILKLHPAVLTSQNEMSLHEIDLNETLHETLMLHGQPESTTITYTLWVNSNITENYTITLSPEHNSTFYSVMQMAAEQDSHYKFDAYDWPNGHYVHTIADYKEEPSSYRYWLLYRLPNLPDPMNPPSNALITPVGVDGLYVEDGQHYLFWYKKL